MTTIQPSIQISARDQILSAASREQMLLLRDHQTRLAREAQFLELQRENQMSREQLIDHITRAGGGSLEAGLVAFGMGGPFGISSVHHHNVNNANTNTNNSTNSTGLLGPTISNLYPARANSDGTGSGSSGGGGGASMGHLSPP